MPLLGHQRDHTKLNLLGLIYDWHNTIHVFDEVPLLENTHLIRLWTVSKPKPNRESWWIRKDSAWLGIAMACFSWLYSLFISMHNWWVVLWWNEHYVAAQNTSRFFYQAVITLWIVLVACCATAVGVIFLTLVSDMAFLAFNVSDRHRTDVELMGSNGGGNCGVNGAMDTVLNGQVAVLMVVYCF